MTYRAHVLACTIEESSSLALVQLMSSEESSFDTINSTYNTIVRMCIANLFIVEFISSFPSVRCTLILLICLSPLVSVPSLFHDIFPDWSCFLISVSSSFLLSIVPMWNCIIGATDFLSLVALAFSFTCLCYSTRHPSFLGQILSSVFLLASPSRMELLVFLLLFSSCDLFFISFAICRWRFHPLCALLLLLALLLPLPFRRVTFVVATLLPSTSSLTLACSPTQKPFFLLLSALVLLLVVQTRCPLKLGLLVAIPFLLPFRSFLSMAAIAMTPAIALACIGRLTTEEVAAHPPNGRKERRVAALLLFGSVCLLSVVDVSLMQSASQCRRASCMVMLNHWNTSLAAEIEEEANEMIAYLSREGIAKNEVLRVTLNGRESSLRWRRVVSDTEEHAFYLMSMSPEQYILFSPIDPLVMTSAPHQDSFYSLASSLKEEDAVTDRLFAFERKKVSRSGHFQLYHIVFY